MQPPNHDARNQVASDTFALAKGHVAKIVYPASVQVQPNHSAPSTYPLPDLKFRAKKVTPVSVTPKIPAFVRRPLRTIKPGLEYLQDLYGKRQTEKYIEDWPVEPERGVLQGLDAQTDDFLVALSRANSERPASKDKDLNSKSFTSEWGNLGDGAHRNFELRNGTVLLEKTRNLQHTTTKLKPKPEERTQSRPCETALKQRKTPLEARRDTPKDRVGDSPGGHQRDRKTQIIPAQSGRQREHDKVIRCPASMATVQKYAGLPDLDLGTEVYESAVPDLTEASTLPTGSDTSSDNGNSDIDKQELHPETARQFFEPAVVDARNVNFSDTVNGGRRSYQIRSRRRRRRGEDQTEDYFSDDSQEETLQGRLARLRKEAIELQADIARAESSDTNRDDNLLRVDRDEDGDSVYEDTQQAHTDDLFQGVEDVNRTLNDIHLAARKKKTQTLEEEFLSKLSEDQTRSNQRTRIGLNEESLPESSITAIAAFSDRLSTLESLLGVSALSHISSTATSILPTLDVLNTQIETLHSTLTPRSDHNTHELNTTAYSTAHLDPLAEKIRHLISESKRLEQSRKAASKSFEEFLENRDRHANLFHTHTSVHPSPGGAGGRIPLSRTVSGQIPQSQDPITNGAAVYNEQPGNQLSSLFLDSQASKINALYNVLPTIQDLEPLLPVVLERLRALSVMHAGAADVKGDLDEFEKRLAKQEEDVAVWRGVVERVEGELKDGRQVLKENVEVVGRLVGGLESRVRDLKGEKKG